MQQNEQQVPIQVDTVAPAPGGGVRMIGMTVLVAGVPTQVQAQVVAVTGPNGELVDNFTPLNYWLAEMAELREIRRLLCILATQPDPGIELPTVYP